MNRIVMAVAVVLLGWALPAAKPALADPMVTTVSARNMPVIGRDVQEWHDNQQPSCRFVKVVGAEIMAQAPQKVIEHWTVEACGGRRFTYRVVILPEKGHLNDMIGNIETPRGDMPKP